MGMGGSTENVGRKASDLFDPEHRWRRWHPYMSKLAFFNSTS
jgi:hypothetical protein